MNTQQVLDSYVTWVKDNTFADELRENSAKVTVPFMDRHNDHLEIYVQEVNGKYVLTDDGYTINDLSGSGFELNTPKRQQIFDMTVKGYGVQIGENFQLFTEATPATIGQKKHYLIQAMLAVNDMYNLAQESVLSLFKEDVERYFKAEDFLYNKDIKLTGKSGFDHYIDFIMPRSKKYPERLIKTMNTAKKDNALSAIFAFNDITDNRVDGSTNNLVIYNDHMYQPTAEITEAFKAYNVRGIPWSKRSEFKSEFLTQ